MPESKGHKIRKNKAAGICGEVDYLLPSGRKLDALSTTGIGTEIERGSRPQIKKAVSRLKEAVNSGEARKVRLRVKHSELDTGYDEMRRQRVRGELTNLGGTTKIYVPKRRK
jgi:hypothetical protein